MDEPLVATVHVLTLPGVTKTTTVNLPMRLVLLVTTVDVRLTTRLIANRRVVHRPHRIVITLAHGPTVAELITMVMVHLQVAQVQKRLPAVMLGAARPARRRIIPHLGQVPTVLIVPVTAAALPGRIRAVPAIIPAEDLAIATLPTRLLTSRRIKHPAVLHRRLLTIVGRVVGVA